MSDAAVPVRSAPWLLRAEGNVEVALGGGILLTWLAVALGSRLDLALRSPMRSTSWPFSSRRVPGICSAPITLVAISCPEYCMAPASTSGWASSVFWHPLIIGCFVGLVAGYFGGLLDTLLMRVVDITVAFPFFILVIAIVGVLGPGLTNYFIALALVAWVAYARLIRTEVLVLKAAGFRPGRPWTGLFRSDNHRPPRVAECAGLDHGLCVDRCGCW